MSKKVVTVPPPEELEKGGEEDELSGIKSIAMKRWQVLQTLVWRSGNRWYKAAVCAISVLLVVYFFVQLWMNHNSGTVAIFEHAQRMRIDCSNMALHGVVPTECRYYFQHADLSYGTFVFFYTLENFLSVFGPSFFPFLLPNLLVTIVSYALISWIAHSKLALFRPCRRTCCPRASSFSKFDKREDDEDDDEDDEERHSKRNATPRNRKARPGVQQPPQPNIVFAMPHPESPLFYSGMYPNEH